MQTRSKGAEQGFILVVVLWIVTLLTLQISIFNLTIRDAGALAGNELAIARGEALASAGVEFAAARLLEQDDALRWHADGNERTVSFGGARLNITITDEASRFDINEADSEVVASLLQPVGGSQEALTQWIEKNGPLLDPSELARAVGVPADVIQKLVPHLTVYGGDGRINPQVASRDALLMLPGVDIAEVDKALHLRQRGEEVALGSVEKWLTARNGPAYRVEVVVRGESTPAIGWAEAVILIGKDSEAPFRVLRWRYEP